MDFADIWKLVGSVEADFEKRTWRASIGPFKATGVKMFTLRAMTANPALPQRLLSNLFVLPSVMWMDFDREGVTAAIHSLKRLQGETAQESAALSNSAKEADKLLGQLLLMWSGECKNAWGRLETAVGDGGDLRTSGMSTGIREELARTLGEFRRKTLPAVRALMRLLHEDNPIRMQAQERLNHAEAELVRVFGVSKRNTVQPTIEPEAA